MPQPMRWALGANSFKWAGNARSVDAIRCAVFTEVRSYFPSLFQLEYKAGCAVQVRSGLFYVTSTCGRGATTRFGG
jgi:hypothetical protein